MAVLILAALVGAVVLLGVLVGHSRDLVRGAVGRALDLEPVRRLRRRYHRQFAFMARRLEPGSALGVSLTVGVVALVVFGWIFGVIAEDVLDREELATADSPATAYLAANRVGWLDAVMPVVTQFADTLTVIGVLVVVSIAAVVRWRRWQVPLFLLAVAAGTSGLITVIKAAVDRGRPEIGYLTGALDGTAFPSGHSAHAVASYGAVAYLLTRSASWPARAAAWTAVAVVAVLVGFSRLYLGAHWLTDVLAGYALGAGWLAVLVTGVVTYRNVRAERAASDSAR